MKLRLVIERDNVVGRYSAVFPDIPGCGSAGDTIEEAIENAKEVLELWYNPEEHVDVKTGPHVVELSV